MSKVYLAYDRKRKIYVAIKETEKTVDSKGFLRMQSLEKEASILKNLNHKCIPKFYSYLKENGKIYLIMEYVKGDNLEDLINAKGPIDEEKALEIMIDLCKVIRYLHKQNPPVIFRDIKPANIILKPDGKISLIDFGAAITFSVNSTYDTISLGTKDYAAPEQYSNLRQTDERTDIFNLGATFYHLYYGVPPQKYPINFRKNKKTILSDKINAIIMKCTQENSDDRFQNCDELLNALRLLKKVENKGNKKTLISFIILSFLLAGFILLIPSIRYKQLISQGDTEYQTDLKIEYYERAARIKKNDSRAYLSILKVCISDGIFDSNEERYYREILDKYHPLFQRKKHYFINKNDKARLLKETGKAYWFYDENGDLSNGISESSWWFEEALKYSDKEQSQVINAYLKISELFEVNALKNEIPDEATSRQYLNLIEKDNEKNVLEGAVDLYKKIEEIKRVIDRIYR